MFESREIRELCRNCDVLFQLKGISQVKQARFKR